MMGDDYRNGNPKTMIAIVIWADEFVNKYVICSYLCRWICIGFINYFISLHFHHVWCLNCVVDVVFSVVADYTVPCSIDILSRFLCTKFFCVYFFLRLPLSHTLSIQFVVDAMCVLVSTIYDADAGVFSAEMINSRCLTLLLFSHFFLLIQHLTVLIFLFQLFFVCLFYTRRWCRCLVHLFLVLRSNVQFDLDFNTSWTRSLNYFEQCAAFFLLLQSIKQSICFFFLSILIESYELLEIISFLFVCSFSTTCKTYF